MSARLRLLTWVCLLASACVVPTLADLEAKQPLACDAEGRCLEGYSCVKGQCIPGTGRVCLEGEERVCGLQRGECLGGTEVCGSDGVFGPCDLSKVKFGPTYEPVESLCDGKDNDCDGATDEGLTHACPLSQGVCESAVSTCEGGAWTACNADVYLAASNAWQPQETLCDGADNDCDGVVDGAREELVPSSGLPRNAAAVPLGEGSSPDVMLAWEQADRILVRRVLADGGLGPMRTPATTVERSLESWGPAFAQCECSDCNCHLAAWFERYTCTGAVPCNRLVGGMLHSDGWTRVGAQGSPDAGVVMPLFGEDNMGRGGGLQLVRGGNRVAGVFTVTGASGTTVRLISCPANLEGLCQHALLGAGDMPTVSISATGELAAAAWRRDGGLVLGGFPLATMDWNAPSTSWTVVDVADSSGEVEPQLLGDPSVELRLYSLDPVGADGGPPALVFRGPGATCAGGSCVGELASPSVRMETIAPGTGTRMPGDLAASRDGSGGKDLLAYQVGSGTTAEVWMAAHADGGWLEPATRLPGQAASPLWVLPDMLYLESNGALAKDLACHP